MGRIRRSGRHILLAVVAMGSLAAASPSWAQGRPPAEYNLPSQSLADSLRAVAKSAGFEIIFPSADVEGHRAPSLKGRFDVEAAMANLLRGSGLTATISGETIIIRGRSETEAAVASGHGEPGAEIVVTGSRIRGAPTASTVIATTADEMKNAGQYNLGEVARSLPQNFGGGQNPGVGVGAEAFGSQNANSATALNLRGLGPDATLTLLNGRRLVYDSAYQGVDISGIPIAAVDRIEIMPDGASAIYGSDAVGGVANVVLKPDYDGLATSARFGASTDGGNIQQQYSAVAGHRWRTGGLVGTADFSHNTAILARQRSYASNLFGNATLYPFQKYHGAVVSAHQKLLEGLTLTIDNLYGKRRATTEVPFTTSSPATVSGNTGATTTETFLVSPTLKLSISRWSVMLNGIYGTSQSTIDTRFYAGGAQSGRSLTEYRNRTQVAELDAEGPLLSLPGGDVRLALGGGYRTNRLIARRGGRTTKGAVESYYGFGELYIPFVSPSQEIAGIERLTLNAAARYESYPGMADVTTPKLGAIYSPIPQIDLRLSWGKSFKAPTLNQQFQSQTALLYPAMLLGGTNLPSTASALILAGGNMALKPERAESLTAGITLRPVEMVRLELSLFDVDYTNRIVQPITALSSALSNPAYVDLIDRTPTVDELDAGIAGAVGGLINLTGLPYDPANVAAIVDSRYRNVARQSFRGVDLLASAELDLGSAGSLSLTGNASYLDSKRRLSANQAELALTGTIFNPPHWRARGGASWSNRDLILSAHVNYVGPVKDTRFTPAPRVDAMTTLDLTARLSVSDPGIFEGLELQLAALNVLNAKPDIIRTTQPYHTPYDFTNYGPVGRFVSFSLTKRW